MTLAETQGNLKKWAMWLALAIVLFYGGRFLIRSGVGVYRYFLPKEAPAPEAKFGALPKLNMATAKISGQPEYILEISNKDMPQFSDRAYVYSLTEPRANFLAEQETTNLAQELQFDANYVRLDDATFKWTDGQRQRTLTANIVKKDFILSTDPDRLTTIANNSNTIAILDAEEKALQFIKSNNLMSGIDLDNMFTFSVVSDVLQGNIRESQTTTDRSKLIKVNVYRNIAEGENNYPILSRNPRDSLTSIFVTGATEPEDMPNMNFVYWPANYDNKSEYGLSPINAVWDTIKQGNGVISYLKTENSDYYDAPKNLSLSKVYIRRIYMAYYEQRDYTPYLQPIYVFEGSFTTSPEQGKLTENGEIVIYYPAVSGNHVQQ